jgi:hypothetical protein
MSNTNPEVSNKLLSSQDQFNNDEIQCLFSKKRGP